MFDPGPIREVLPGLHDRRHRNRFVCYSLMMVPHNLKVMLNPFFPLAKMLAIYLLHPPEQVSLSLHDPVSAYLQQQYLQAEWKMVVTKRILMNDY